jgi:chemosensory pili system protein ChpC
MPETELDMEVPTFVVPLQKSNILVPKASVAEIIPYEPLQQIPDTPDWFLGFLRWRGVQVPVASFEMLTKERASFSLVSVSSASLVIVKVLGVQDDFSYMAIVAQQAPELVTMTAAQLFETGDPVEKTELVKARYADQNISIPDLDYIESEIRLVAFS